MQADPVDPRDVTWEVVRPTYRVYFWSRQQDPEVPSRWGGFMSREHRVVDASSVHAVVAWADQSARPGESYTLYVEHEGPNGVGLIQLAGTDPTSGRD